MTVLVDTLAYKPWINVCIDTLLPRHALRSREPVARLWVNPASVVVGRNLRIEENVDVGMAGKLGIPIVRRFTGGGAVFHDYGNLNLSIAVPTPGRVSPSAVYRVGTGIVVRALERLGLRGRVENHSDVVVDGWKVSGGAAYVSRDYYLYHATLLVETDAEVISLLTPPRMDLVSKGVHAMSKYRPRNLSSIVDGVSIGEAWAALLDSVEEVLGPISMVVWEDGRQCTGLESVFMRFKAKPS